MTNWADILINLFAAASLIALSFNLKRGGSVALIEARVALVAQLAAFMVFLRAIFWWNGSAWLEAASLLAAVSLPLLILMAGEVLMRRHAHVVVKVLAALWALGGGAMILWGRPEPLFTYANAAMQVGIPAFCIGWILMRDPAQHSPAENRNMSVFMLALMFIVLLSVTDFPEIVSLPVRFGAIAMLVVAYVLVFASHREYSNRRAGFELAAIATSVLAFLGSARLILGAGNWGAAAQLAALLLAILLTTVILVRVISRRFKLQEFSKDTIAAARTESVDAFIEDTLLARESAATHVLGPDQLTDYDTASLSEYYTEHPVITRDWLSAQKGQSVAQEQVLDLLNRFGANYSLMIPGSAPTVVLSATPALSNGPDQLAYFKLVAKMARLISQKETP